MEKQDLILDFIDGKLDSEQTDILFEHLFYDESSRSNFAQQIQLLLSINKHIKPLPVPTTVTNNIFNQLGIRRQPPLFALVQFFKTNLFRRIAVATGIILLALSSFYLGNWYNQNYTLQSTSAYVNQKSGSIINYPIVTSSDISSPNSTKNFTSTSEPLAYSENQSRNHLFLMSLANYSIYQNAVTNLLNKQYRSFLRNTITQNSLNSTFDKNSSKNINSPNHSQDLYEFDVAHNNSIIFHSSSQIPNLNQNIFRQQKTTNANKQTSPIDMNELRNSLLPKDSKYELHLLSMISQHSNPTSSIPTESKNFELTAGYNFDFNHSVGLNIGYDNFPQTFKRNILGKQIQQSQNPYLLYAGMSYRFIYFNSPTNPYLFPYFDVMAGFSQVGPLFKLGAGANIPIWNNLELNLGLVNSLLLYNVENIIYSTNKLNFVYGLNIKF